MRYNGTVLSVSATKTGGHLIMDAGRVEISPKDKPVGVTEVVIFVSGGAALKADIDKGDNVSVVGTVSIYNGRREISVDKPADIAVFKSSGD